MKYPCITLMIAALLLASQNAVAYTDVGIDVQTMVNATCPCSTLSGEDLNVMITNLGTSRETYTLSLILPDDETWSGFISPAITLSPEEGESAGAFFITPSCSVAPGIYTLAVMVNSSASGKWFVKEFDIGVLACHSIGIETGEYGLCKGMESLFPISVFNLGIGDERVILSASESWVGFPERTFDIGQGEEANLTVLFSPPEDVSGTMNITISAKSTTSYAFSEKTFTVDIRDCYALDVTIEPEMTVVCPCEHAEFMLSIYNSGIMQDTYIVSFDNRSTEVTLKAGESGEIRIPIEVPCDMEEGEYEIGISIDSTTPGVAEVSFHVLSLSECYSVSMLDGTEIESVEVGKAVTYTITVSNEGRFDRTYELLMDAPDWIHLSEKRVVVGAGEKKDIYLYAAPNYYVDAGNYSAALSAITEIEQAGLEFKVNVRSDFSMEGEPPWNETWIPPSIGEGEYNITMNISIPTGGILAGAGEDQDRPWTQIMMLTILAIGVVVILILRFVIMIK
jgi:uncharacterized membrane protein